MRGRRAFEAYDPARARCWAAVAVVGVVLGALHLAAAVGFILADWDVTGRSSLAASGGFVFAVFGVVAYALHCRAVDGPVGEADLFEEHAALWSEYPATAPTTSLPVVGEAP